MEKRLKWDGTAEGREKILSRYLGFRVKEEQRYKDGTYLVITDEPYVEPPPPRDLEADVDRLIKWAKEHGFE